MTRQKATLIGLIAVSYTHLLVQKRENLSDWDTDSDVLSLLDVVRNVKPDILIGVSGQTGPVSYTHLDVYKRQRQDAEVIMKLTDADNAADGIFFPALEQNMMGAVLINENDEVMFFKMCIRDRYSLFLCNNFINVFKVNNRVLIMIL